VGAVLGGHCTPASPEIRSASSTDSSRSSWVPEVQQEQGETGQEFSEHKMPQTERLCQHVFERAAAPLLTPHAHGQGGTKKDQQNWHSFKRGRVSAILRAKNDSTQKKINRVAVAKDVRNNHATGDEKSSLSSFWATL